MTKLEGIGRRKRKLNIDRSFLSKRFMIFALLALGLALAYVHIKFEETKLGYDISTNNKKEKEISRENLILQAEFIKLKSPERIESIARELGFKFPTQEDVIYVEETTVVGEKK
jgi:cell division protein FtsL